MQGPKFDSWSGNWIPHAASKSWKWKGSHSVWLFETPWTVAYQAPLSMGFSRQEYWSGLPFPSPGDLPNPGIETKSPALQANAFTIWVTREAASKSWNAATKDPRAAAKIQHNQVNKNI